jgi:bifunctional non-homologous end joining protein LigD
VLDGKAMISGVDGVPRFNDLHSRKHEEEVQLYPFHCRALEGEDLRELPLSIRKVNLARLLARRPDGISVADFEHGEIGPDLFRKACEFGLEGTCGSAPISLRRRQIDGLDQGEKLDASGDAPRNVAG